MERERVIKIDALAFGGEGIGRDEGKVVFVPGTAPGDRLRVRVLSDHGRFERAEALELIERSQDRVEPPCPVFGVCGGCQWQHIRYESQLRWKEQFVRESIERIGKISEPQILPILGAPEPWNYRNRIQLKSDFEGKLGFFAAGTHRVVPIQECLIADKRLNSRLRELQDSEQTRGDLTLSVNGGGVVETHHAVEEEGIFSQVNPVQNRRLIETVLQFAFGNSELVFSRKKTVVELHAGAGNFTIPLAERAGQVLAIEENKHAVSEGQKRQEKSGASNIEWIEGGAEWGLKKIYRKKMKPDLLVLDPPRRGAKEILDLILVVRPRLIVYVSCDPATLGRDLYQLTRRYYRLEVVQPIDMFPQTYHVESVAQLALL